MRPGDLIGFTTPDKFGAVIRFGQHRLMHLDHWQINHIAVVESVIGPVVSIIQAVRTVDRVSLSSYGDTPHVVIPFPGQDNRRDDVVAFAQSKLGAKYGVLSVVSRAFNMLTPEVIRISANHNGDGDCSCLGARAWEHGGVILPWTDTYQVTPGQIPETYGMEAA